MVMAVARIGDSFTDGDTVAQGSGNVFVNNLPVARLGDATTGEGCYPSVVIISGSGSVFANNIPVARLGDLKSVHCCDDDCHDGVISSASGNVFTG